MAVFAELAYYCKLRFYDKPTLSAEYMRVPLSAEASKSHLSGFFALEVVIIVSAALLLLSIIVF